MADAHLCISDWAFPTEATVTQLGGTCGSVSWISMSAPVEKCSTSRYPSYHSLLIDTAPCRLTQATRLPYNMCLVINIMYFR
jgi:hypothetical protein